MKRTGKITVSVTINRHGNRCADNNGKYCKYRHTRKFGAINECMLFRDEHDNPTFLKIVTGYVMRCKECLNAEEESHPQTSQEKDNEEQILHS